MPDVLVMGGDGGSMNALAAVLTNALKGRGLPSLPAVASGSTGNGQSQQINTPAIPPSDA